MLLTHAYLVQFYKRMLFDELQLSKTPPFYRNVLYTLVSKSVAVLLIFHKQQTQLQLVLCRSVEEEHQRKRAAGFLNPFRPYLMAERMLNFKSLLLDDVEAVQSGKRADVPDAPAMRRTASSAAAVGDRPGLTLLDAFARLPFAFGSAGPAACRTTLLVGGCFEGPVLFPIVVFVAGEQEFSSTRGYFLGFSLLPNEVNKHHFNSGE